MSAASKTARVALVDREQAPLLARRFYGDGPTSPITASLAQVPELLEVTLPFIGAALGPAGLDERAKEIAILRTSALLDCHYCVQTHSAVALDAGLSSEEVRALRGEGEIAAAFTDPRERAMIGWIDAVAAGRGPVDPAIAARTSDLLEDHVLVELTLTVAATLMLNRYCTALELADQNESHRRELAEAFSLWEASIEQAMANMRAADKLRPDADPSRLASTTLAAIQGRLPARDSLQGRASDEGHPRSDPGQLRSFAAPGDG